MTETPLDPYDVEPTTYGLASYGQNLYGVTVGPFSPIPLPPSWNTEPFVAVNIAYGQVAVTWATPAALTLGDGLQFMLISNRYGFPVDQTDGDVLYESANWPGNVWFDSGVYPGSYMYYGLFVQLNATTDQWQRIGCTGVLVTEDDTASAWVLNNLPPVFTQNLNGDLTQDALGNTYLSQFISVLGWGIDYVQTQTDMLARHLNEPMGMSESDLYNLCQQLGVPWNSKVSAYWMRKAAANWAHIVQERGTDLGIENQLSLLTGFGVDLQTGQNIMLENDQSQPLHPLYNAWSSSIAYNVGEIVSYGGYIYQCSATGNRGYLPTDTSYWTGLVNATEETGILVNPASGMINTWEAIYPYETNGLTPNAPNGYNTTTGAWTYSEASLVETVGAESPLTDTGSSANVLTLVNREGSAQDMIARSISRTTGQQALPGSGTSGPILTGPVLNQNFDFETGVSPWTEVGSATVSQSDAWSNTGTYSLAFVGNGTTASPGAASEQIPVVAGRWYYITGWAYCASSYSSGIELYANWYGAGSVVSSSTPASGALVGGTALFLSAYVQAPTTAQFAAIVCTAEGTPADTLTFNIDTVKLRPAFVPDMQQVIENGIPVPFTRSSQEWSSSVRYGTGDIVTYDNQPFMALRASTGSTPPFGSSATTQWTPLSDSPRLPLMVSAYTSQNLTEGTNYTVPVIPFVEWYDQWGYYIGKCVGRNSGSASVPPNLAYDSFTTQPGAQTAFTTLDTPAYSWANWIGDGFTRSSFAGGTCYITEPGTDTVSYCGGWSGGANCNIAATLITAATDGQTTGVMFRGVSSTPKTFWFAAPSALYYYNGTTYTQEGASYSTEAQMGDRLAVECDGTSITVLVNNVVVLQVTSSTNESGILHGIGVVTL